MTESSVHNHETALIWQQLSAHQQQNAKLHMRDLFRLDPERARKYSIRLDDLLVDFSKHRISDETMKLLLSLAEAREISNKIDAMFSGEKINVSENRPALHTLLRAPAQHHLLLDDENLMPLVHTQRTRMRAFVEKLQAGEVRGSSGKVINKVISIGIGGSDLGPRLAVDALANYKTGDIDVEFVANLDPKDLVAVLARSDAESSMVLVASKSFSTLETRTNADAVKHWLSTHGCNDLQKHLIAVTSNCNAALEFGAAEEYIFQFWDWVGGRYSLWSSVGLPIAIAIGMDKFEEMLAGAHIVDKHFQIQPHAQNLPVILALLSIWYTNFYRAETHAVIPYDQSLRLLPDYLSQLVMESNGKSVTREAQPVDWLTSPVLWGSIGTNAQHAFFQLLHQGTHLVPVDFILPLQNKHAPEQQMKLVANCFAQSEALMKGQVDDKDANRNFPGNVPSTTFVYSALTPWILGMLIAVYEHKTFVEAMLWDINPFDQWGVELGKQLAGQMINDLSLTATEVSASDHDASTLLLMQEYLDRNK